MGPARAARARDCWSSGDVLRRRARRGHLSPLAVLGWCLKASLRAGEDDSDVVSTMLPPATAETVLAARKRPVALLRGAHAIVAEEVAAGRLDAQAHLSLLTQLHSLNAQIGV